MPEISTFGDVEELDNRYIDKSVVYVEGEDDQKVWERIIGSDVADKLEFKVPSQAGAVLQNSVEAGTRRTFAKSEYSWTA